MSQSFSPIAIVYYFTIAEYPVGQISGKTVIRSIPDYFIPSCIGGLGVESTTIWLRLRDRFYSPSISVFLLNKFLIAEDKWDSEWNNWENKRGPRPWEEGGVIRRPEGFKVSP